MVSTVGLRLPCKQTARDPLQTRLACYMRWQTSMELSKRCAHLLSCVSGMGWRRVLQQQVARLETGAWQTCRFLAGLPAAAAFGLKPLFDAPTARGPFQQSSRCLHTTQVLGILIVRGQSPPAQLLHVLDEEEWALTKAETQDPMVRQPTHMQKILFGYFLVPYQDKDCSFAKYGSK